MVNFGKVMFQGREITLTSEADFTNRRLESKTNYDDVPDGEEFDFELSARGVDEEGNEVEVYWIFTDVKGDGKSLDSFDYGDVRRVAYL